MQNLISEIVTPKGVQKKRRKHIAFIIANIILQVFICVIFFMAPSFAETYYVSLAGHDINDGLTLETAFRTIQKAADIAIAGDIIEVQTGTYNESVLITTSGTQNNSITYRADGEVIISAQKPYAIKLDNVDYIEIEGFIFCNVTDNGIMVEGEDNNHNIIADNICEDKTSISSLNSYQNQNYTSKIPTEVSSNIKTPPLENDPEDTSFSSAGSGTDTTFEPLISQDKSNKLISISSIQIFNGSLASGSISGNVTLQGRTNHESLITFCLTNPGESSPFAAYEITTAFDGNYTIANIPAGIYNLSAKSPISLRQNQILIEVTEGGEIPNIDFNLLGGDANGDNSVATGDMVIMRMAWLSNPESPNWDERADFNGDGSIGTGDMAIMQSNWFKNGIEHQITITSPEDNSFVGISPITVSGTIDNNSAQVVVNGITATVASNTFTAEIPLTEGQNIITAIATDTTGNKNADIVTVTYDATPPTTPIVTDDGTYNTSLTELHATWTESIDPESGILEYQYSIGTSISETDVVGWTSIGTNTEITCTGLNLTQGQSYYFNVKAINGALIESYEGYSDGITIDITSPTNPIVIDDGQYTSSIIELHAYWISQDYESDIIENQYSIGTSPGATDITGWTSTGIETEVTHTNLSLTHGQIYYLNVKTKNGALVWSEVGSSDGIIINAHSPLINSIAPEDNSTFYTGTQVTINVDAQDIDSDPLEYQFLVDDEIKQSWNSSSSYEWTALPTTSLIRKITCQVKDDKEGQVSQSVSYNIEIDLNDSTPPTTPIVTADEYSNSLTSLHASWYAEDPESGITEFRYAIGTTEDGIDIVDWTSAGTDTGVTHGGLQLIEGQNYYFTVTATNGVGLTSDEGHSSPSNASTEVTIIITSPQNNSIVTSNEFTIKGIAKGTNVIKINDKDVFVNPDGTFTGPTLVAPGKAARMKAKGEDLSNHIIMNFPDKTEITAEGGGQDHAINVYYYQFFVKVTTEDHGYDGYFDDLWEHKYKIWNMNLLTKPPFDGWGDSSKNYYYMQKSAYWGDKEEYHFVNNGAGWANYYESFSAYDYTPSEEVNETTTNLTIHTLPRAEGKKIPMIIIFKDYELSTYYPNLSSYSFNGHSLKDLGDQTAYITLTDYTPDNDISLVGNIPQKSITGEFPEGTDPPTWTYLVKYFHATRIELLTVEMTAYRPQTTPFKWWTYTIPESDEESPGAGIRINGDDDSVTGEDDLIMVTLEVATVPAPQGIEYVLRSTSSNINVWKNQTKGAIILDGEGEEVITFDEENQKNVWVEYTGTDGGSAYLEFEVRSAQSQEVLLEDRIRFYPFRSVVIAFGGEDQTPSDPPDGNHGTFRIARDLYLDGYDVHMFDEDELWGGACAEARRAVEERGVKQIAIFGYSHGGGATYLLADYLDNNRGSIAGTFTITYTAYIDAVKDEFPWFGAEERRPPSTRYLTNYYQAPHTAEDKFLGGGAINDPLGVNYEINVSNTNWGTNITHFDIDDNQDVSSGVVTRLKQNVNK